MARDVGDLSDTSRRAAGLVADRARALAPRVSGRLAGDIRVEVDRVGPDGSTADVLVGSSLVPYAGPIHFGWHDRNIEPQPFLTDAQDDERDAVVALYAAEVADGVRRIDRTTPP
jgi:hypothetical protein